MNKIYIFDKKIRYSIKLPVFDKISIFDKKYPCLTKFSIFDESSVSWQKTRFLRKISVFDKKFENLFNCYVEFVPFLIVTICYFWGKCQFYIQHFDSWPKFIWLTQIPIFDVKVLFFYKIFIKNFWGKSFPCLTKISKSGNQRWTNQEILSFFDFLDLSC